MLRNNKTVQYAVLGGLLSIPFVVSSNFVSGVENQFSTTVLILGGLLAGYLAGENDANAMRAGIGAGVIGGIPGYIWILPQMIQTATAWSTTAGTVGILVIMIPAVIGVAALPGGIGGIVGGWVATKLGTN
jgi:hypothetical protein